MTIDEALNKYDLDVNEAKKQHYIKCQKSIKNSIIFSVITIVVGIVLLIIGKSLPPEISVYDGHESESIEAMIYRCFGSSTLVIGVIFLIILPYLIRKEQKKGPKDFLEQNKRLYLNLIMCENITEEGRERYRQELEEIRQEELRRAIRRAGR